MGGGQVAVAADRGQKQDEPRCDEAERQNPQRWAVADGAAQRATQNRADGQREELGQETADAGTGDAGGGLAALQPRVGRR
jgi:hypothetical protein